MDRFDQFLKIAGTITGDESTAKKYAEHLEELFSFLDPARISEACLASIAAGDYAEAVRLCAAYYREKADSHVPELSAKGTFDIAAADKAAAGGMRVINIDHCFLEGDVDFLFNPTLIHGPVNHEWLWGMNRHGCWINMARTYRATGDSKYALAFEKQLLKWIAQTYIPENWNGPGSAWRTIECGLRLMGSWQVAFDGFKNAVSDLSLLLMIASMHRQSVHLVKHPTSHNWLMMEANGAYTFSALFPELKDAKENRQIAAGWLQEELEKQILPDGMHDELSPDYQSVVYNCAASFYGLAKALGIDSEIPEEFTDMIRSTAKAAVLLSTPGFTQPRTNDTYTISTDVFTQKTEALFGYDPVMRFVNSKRAEGTPPEGETASAFLPYAGFVVMRNDWSQDSAYLCFDVGPLGTGHMHQDKLNINVFKGSQELIYDDGGGQYEQSPARRYGVSGYAHNTVLVDGLAQHRREPLRTSEAIDAGWITNPEFDYAVGTYEDTFGPDFVKPAVHKREVRFCKPGFFCVSDHLVSVDGNEHDYEVLFHLDTLNVKPLKGYQNGVISRYGKKYEVAMIPLDEEGTAVELHQVSAQTEPNFQGWYMGRNENNLHKAITVSRKIENVKNFRFTTLIFPVKAGEDLPEVVKNPDGTVFVKFEGKQYCFKLNQLNQ